MERREKDSMVIHRSVMKQCEDSHFLGNGLTTESEALKKIIARRICFDTDDPMYKV